MINTQEKAAITKLLNQYGPERVLKAMERQPTPHDWNNCFMACIYGEKGELHNFSMQAVPLIDADTKIANALGITLPELTFIAGLFDTNTVAFIELVPEAVGVGI